MRKLLRDKELRPIVFGAIFLLISVLVGALWEHQPSLWGLPIPTLVCSLAALITCGWDIYVGAIRRLIRGSLLDETFLMSIASVAAFIIGEYVEGIVVVLFYRLGEYFEHRAVRRSRTAIKSLMSINPDTAYLWQNGEETKIDAQDVKVGDILVLHPGDRVPVDCTVTEGFGSVDTSCLTGESLPRDVAPGDSLPSGIIVTNARLIAMAEKPSGESAAARVLSLVETATERKSRQERFITVFSRIYTPIVVLLACCVAILPPLVTGFTLAGFLPWLRRGLMLLVVSCPCALVISVPLAFFGGIGNAAAKGILFKGGVTFDKFAKAKTAVFDKTGTLTTGAFSVISLHPVAGITEEELLTAAAAAEAGSLHPIAQAIRKTKPDAPIPHQIQELAGYGVISQTSVGEVAVGNLRLMEKVGAHPTHQTGVHIAKNGVYMGSISVGDIVKEGAKEAVSHLREQGIQTTVMLTGDHREAADFVGTALNIDKVYASLLPEDKYRHLDALMQENQGGVIYVGDGINDAPSLALSDVGIAMGGVGSDAAIESADVVIMNDDLKKVGEAMGVAKRTLRIAGFNIVFALFIKILVMVCATLGLLDFSGGMWFAVFSDVGVTLIAILNALRLVFPKQVKGYKTS